MAVRALHTYVSDVEDELDPDLVGSDEWNADHAVKLTGPALVGRTDASDGDAAEIAVGSGLALATDTLSADYSSQAEAEAGTDNAKLMTALRVAQAIAALGYTGVESGTREDFQQTSAPTGWTKETGADYNDASPRCVTGTASFGGSTAFSTVFSTTAVQSHALTTAELASHPHPDSFAVGATPLPYGPVTPGAQPQRGRGQVSPNSIALSHDHPLTGGVGAAGSGSAHIHNLTLTVKFVDFILATKA